MQMLEHGCILPSPAGTSGSPLKPHFCSWLGQAPQLEQCQASTTQLLEEAGTATTPHRSGVGGEGGEALLPPGEKSGRAVAGSQQGSGMSGAVSGLQGLNTQPDHSGASPVRSALGIFMPVLPNTSVRAHTETAADMGIA